MNVADVVERDCLKKFKILSLEEAVTNQYIGWEDYVEDGHFNESRNCIYEFDGEKAVRLLYIDNGDYDQRNTLERNYCWIVHELNKLANIINKSEVQ